MIAVGRLTAVAVLALPLAACSGESAAPDPSEVEQALTSAAPWTADDQAAVDEVAAMPLVRTLNGEVPPGKPTLVHTSVLDVDTIRDGLQVRVYRDVREAGTRAPIHVHPFGGWTCVGSGQAILYVEGMAPQRAAAGECVEMPALVPMSNANPGPGPSVLFDNFVTPVGAPVWRIVEEGQTDLGDEFATGPSERVNPGHAHSG